MKYNSASETETDQKPDEPLQETIDRDVDAGKVRAMPGTGGPDDEGDVEVSSEDLNLPGASSDHRELGSHQPWQRLAVDSTADFGDPEHEGAAVMS